MDPITVKLRAHGVLRFFVAAALCFCILFWLLGEISTLGFLVLVAAPPLGISLPAWAPVIVLPPTGLAFFFVACMVLFLIGWSIAGAGLVSMLLRNLAGVDRFILEPDALHADRRFMLRNSKQRWDRDQIGQVVAEKTLQLVLKHRSGSNLLSDLGSEVERADLCRRLRQHYRLDADWIPPLPKGLEIDEDGNLRIGLARWRFSRGLAEFSGTGNYHQGKFALHITTDDEGDKFWSVMLLTDDKQIRVYSITSRLDVAHALAANLAQRTGFPYQPPLLWTAGSNVPAAG